MLPPFYYKGVTDEGSVPQLLRGDRARRRRAPAHLPLPHPAGRRRCRSRSTLIERLLKRYPGIVAGVKDSSGDWTNTKAMLERFAATASTSSPAASRSCSTACAAAAGLHHRDRQRQSRRDPPRCSELALDGRRRAAGSDHRDAQDRAESADDPGAEEPSPRTSATTPRGAPCARPLTELTAAEDKQVLTELTAAGFSMPGL